MFCSCETDSNHHSFFVNGKKRTCCHICNKMEEGSSIGAITAPVYTEEEIRTRCSDCGWFYGHHAAECISKLVVYRVERQEAGTACCNGCHCGPHWVHVGIYRTPEKATNALINYSGRYREDTVLGDVPVRVTKEVVIE